MSEDGQREPGGGGTAHRGRPGAGQARQPSGLLRHNPGLAGLPRWGLLPQSSWLRPTDRGPCPTTDYIRRRSCPRFRNRRPNCRHPWMSCRRGRRRPRTTAPPPVMRPASSSRLVPPRQGPPPSGGGEEIKARGGKAKDDLASAWASLRAHVQEQFEKIRAGLHEKRDDLDAKAAGAAGRAGRVQRRRRGGLRQLGHLDPRKPRRRPSRLPRLG